MTTIHTNISANGITLTISVEGRFDFSALPLFRSAYEKQQPKPQAYIIDLSKADYLDSSALGMLLALRDYAGGDAANIRLKNPNPDVKKILVITKLDELFEIE
ncbi:MAG: STAS domain-containing protein [Gammaproteobacteria bacterium]|nr:STAS domain-containing protein [Gammaproteobacteria bacterium]MBP9728664.1 STAS domain-containing protein [Gammaproteobacteria bacterium]